MKDKVIEEPKKINWSVIFSTISLFIVICGFIFKVGATSNEVQATSADVQEFKKILVKYQETQSAFSQQVTMLNYSFETFKKNTEAKEAADREQRQQMILLTTQMIELTKNKK